MKRRAFIQQCGVFPILAATGGLCEASNVDDHRSIREYCFDGTYAEFELVLGHDLSRCLSESTQFLDSFRRKIERTQDQQRTWNREMPSLSILHPGDLPRRSLAAREYRIVVLGVEICTNVVSSDFPIAGQHHLQAARRQLEQIYREILQVNESHQRVWAALHPPVAPEYDPITGKRIFRN
jgi:hypothetical protein